MQCNPKFISTIIQTEIQFKNEKAKLHSSTFWIEQFVNIKFFIELKPFVGAGVSGLNELTSTASPSWGPWTP